MNTKLRSNKVLLYAVLLLCIVALICTSAVFASVNTNTPAKASGTDLPVLTQDTVAIAFIKGHETLAPWDAGEQANAGISTIFNGDILVFSYEVEGSLQSYTAYYEYTTYNSKSWSDDSSSADLATLKEYAKTTNVYVLGSIIENDLLSSFPKDTTAIFFNDPVDISAEDYISQVCPSRTIYNVIYGIDNGNFNYFFVATSCESITKETGTLAEFNSSSMGNYVVFNGTATTLKANELTKNAIGITFDDTYTADFAIKYANAVFTSPTLDDTIVYGVGPTSGYSSIYYDGIAWIDDIDNPNCSMAILHKMLTKYNVYALGTIKTPKLFTDSTESITIVDTFTADEVIAMASGLVPNPNDWDYIIYKYGSGVYSSVYYYEDEWCDDSDTYTLTELQSKVYDKDIYILGTITEGTKYNITIDDTNFNGCTMKVFNSNGDAITKSIKGRDIVVEIEVEPNYMFDYESFEVYKKGDAKTVVGSLQIDYYLFVFEMPAYDTVVTGDFIQKSVMLTKSATGLKNIIKFEEMDDVYPMIYEDDYFEPTSERAVNRVVFAYAEKTGHCLYIEGNPKGGWGRPAACKLSDMITMMKMGILGKVYVLGEIIDEGYSLQLDYSCWSEEQGTVLFKVDGVEATHAFEGQTITLEITPNEGYAIDGCGGHDDTYRYDIDIDGTSFDMPDYDVTIYAYFYELGNKNPAKGIFGPYVTNQINYIADCINYDALKIESRLDEFSNEDDNDEAYMPFNFLGSYYNAGCKEDLALLLFYIDSLLGTTGENLDTTPYNNLYKLFEAQNSENELFSLIAQMLEYDSVDENLTKRGFAVLFETAIDKLFDFVDSYYIDPSDEHDKFDLSPVYDYLLNAKLNANNEQPLSNADRILTIMYKMNQAGDPDMSYEEFREIAISYVVNSRKSSDNSILSARANYFKSEGYDVTPTWKELTTKQTNVLKIYSYLAYVMPFVSVVMMPDCIYDAELGIKDACTNINIALLKDTNIWSKIGSKVLYNYSIDEIETAFTFGNDNNLQKTIFNYLYEYFGMQKTVSADFGEKYKNWADTGIFSFNFTDISNAGDISFEINTPYGTSESASVGYAIRPEIVAPTGWYTNQIIVYKKGNHGVKFYVNGSTFKMPAYDIEIEVVFKEIQKKEPAEGVFGYLLTNEIDNIANLFDISPLAVEEYLVSWLADTKNADKDLTVLKTDSVETAKMNTVLAILYFEAIYNDAEATWADTTYSDLISGMLVSDIFYMDFASLCDEANNTDNVNNIRYLNLFNSRINGQVKEYQKLFTKQKTDTSINTLIEYLNAGLLGAQTEAKLNDAESIRADLYRMIGVLLDIDKADFDKAFDDFLVALQDDPYYYRAYTNIINPNGIEDESELFIYLSGVEDPDYYAIISAIACFLPIALAYNDRADINGFMSVYKENYPNDTDFEDDVLQTVRCFLNSDVILKGAAKFVEAYQTKNFMTVITTVLSLYPKYNDEYGKGYCVDKTGYMNIAFAKYLVETFTLDITYDSTDVENGSLTVDTSALSGTEVNVTVTPDAGYYESITIYRTGDAQKTDLDIFDAEEYMFIMPDFAVTIEVTFIEKDDYEYDGETQTYVYDGDEKEYDVDESHSFTITYYSDEECTSEATSIIDAGTYYVILTREEDDTYKEFISDAITLVIEKADFDMSEVEWSYVEPYSYANVQYTVYLKNLPKDLSATYINGIGIHAGEYVTEAVFEYNENNYNQPSFENLTWEILKADYDLSKVEWDYQGAFEYDGTVKTVALTGRLPWGVAISYEDNSSDVAGKHVAKAIFDYDEVNYNEPIVDDLVWDIKAKNVEAENDIGEQIVVINMPKGGFAYDLVLDANKQTVTQSGYDFSKYVGENQEVAFVYDVKFVKVINGVETVIDSNEIVEGKITVKFLLPSNINVNNIAKIIHAHSKDDITEFTFNKDNVDEYGYYSFETDKLSEFAFITNIPENVEDDVATVLGTKGTLIAVACGIVLFGAFVTILVVTNVKKKKQ